MQYLTAWFAFTDVANLQAGDHVVITAASGGAGLAAIQIANALGARTMATTRASSKQFINTNIASGKLKPVITSTFPLAEIQEAHRYMESNEQIGKIVLTV